MMNLENREKVGSLQLEGISGVVEDSISIKDVLATWELIRGMRSQTCIDPVLWSDALSNCTHT